MDISHRFPKTCNYRLFYPYTKEAEDLLAFGLFFLRF
jgi:hypothetical protein